MVSVCLSRCSSCPHHGLLQVIGFDAAYEEGLTRSQRLHQRIQRLTELANQGGHTLLGIHVLLQNRNIVSTNVQ